MKKRIAMLLCFVLMVSVFSGCSLVLGGLAIVLPNLNQTEPTEPAGPELMIPEGAELITIAEALELCGAAGNVTEERYYIRGTIVSIDNATYGAMTIKDDTGTISVYNSTDANGTSYANMEEKPYKDYEVLLHCILQNHNGTKEVKQAHIISFVKNEADVDDAQYTACTLDEARNAAKGAKVKVTGVVARITYAFGQKPAGFMLVDDTGSIYVYDSDLAVQVKEGNKITIQAEKDYWILDTELNNANKFGYKGCNQLTNAVLISNDKGNNDFNKSWIETTTVKKIVDTPVYEDISTNIFKVTALIKKVPGDNFVNYYINDLDGTTGAYTYTQCNGSDFAWLDAFDGKICTVYLTALNAKSTASDCYWRLLPVAVVDEGFDPTTVNLAENAVKYYGVTQFLTEYTGNPALKLMTTVENKLLGYTGAILSYASSDPSVISVDGNIMNCHKSGTATITVTGSYDGETYEEKVTITVTIIDNNGEYSSVKEAIDALVGTTVEVKGVVGPSLINQNGFYLIDESGVIAVLVEKTEVLDSLEIGNEVVLSAIRAFKSDNGSEGQDHLLNATVIVNNYGEHAYSTHSFQKNKTFAEFSQMVADNPSTTGAYVLTATVKLAGSAFYTNVYLTDGTNEIQVYAGNGKTQLGWLIEMDGQEITVEVAVCNWNNKGYKLCVLAVINADGTKTVNNLNFK